MSYASGNGHFIHYVINQLLLSSYYVLDSAMDLKDKASGRSRGPCSQVLLGESQTVHRQTYICQREGL